MIVRKITASFSPERPSHTWSDGTWAMMGPRKTWPRRSAGAVLLCKPTPARLQHSTRY